MMNKTGVYKIINEETGDFYIGSARVNFKKRYRQHFNDLKRGKHNNPLLQRSYNKHIDSIFYFVILEIVVGENEILDREQYYIDTLNPRYNVCRSVRQPGLGRKMSQEQIDNLIRINTGRIAWNKGIPFNEEVRHKMSIAKQGYIPWNINKDDISNRKVIRDDGKIYLNMNEAAKDLNVKANTIVKSINDDKVFRYVKGYKFQYLDNMDKGFGFKPLSPDKYIHINTDKFIIRYTDINGDKIYKGRFDTREEAIIIRNELLTRFPAR